MLKLLRKTYIYFSIIGILVLKTTFNNINIGVLARTHTHAHTHTLLSISIGYMILFKGYIVIIWTHHNFLDILDTCFVFFQGHNLDDIIMCYVAWMMNKHIKKRPSAAGVTVGESLCWNNNHLKRTDWSIISHTVL